MTSNFPTITVELSAGLIDNADSGGDGSDRSAAARGADEPHRVAVLRRSGRAPRSGQRQARLHAPRRR
jgi:hypothetical protein